jgi:hypothetical protein
VGRNREQFESSSELFNNIIVKFNRAILNQFFISFEDYMIDLFIAVYKISQNVLFIKHELKVLLCL